MASGVTLHVDCVPAYNEIKLGHKYRYIVYALTPDLKKIHVLKTAPPSATYDNFVEDLKESEAVRECRYGVFDADFTLSDGQSRSKLVFFLWSPECATVKQKMIYTSSKLTLRKTMVGISKEIQACDYGDLEWPSILESLIRSQVAQ